MTFNSFDLIKKLDRNHSIIFQYSIISVVKGSGADL